MNDDEIKLTILAVDDEPGILSTLQRQLRKQNFNLLTAPSAMDALEIMSSETVHIVISDMRMPEMDGAEFLAKVNQEWPETVRILLTGYSEMEATVKAINEGRIFSYLAKPWDGGELIALLERARGYYLSKSRKNIALVKSVKSNQALKDKVAQQQQALKKSTALVDMAQKEVVEAYDTAIEVMANLIDLSIPNLAGVNREIAQLCTFIGSHLGLDENCRRNLKLAGLLFQVGKLSLDKELVSTPYEALSSEQKVCYDQYPLMGEQALTALAPLSDATMLIKMHQERLDGSGYPNGVALSEEQKAFHILSAVVKFKELSKGLVTQYSMSEAEAVRWMRSQTGAYSDEVLDILEQLTVSEQQEAGTKTKVSGFALMPGMVIAESIYGRQGMLVLSKGHVLDPPLIGKLISMESQLSGPIYVFEDKGEPALGAQA